MTTTELRYECARGADDSSSPKLHPRCTCFTGTHPLGVPTVNRSRQWGAPREVTAIRRHSSPDSYRTTTERSRSTERGWSHQSGASLEERLANFLDRSIKYCGDVNHPYGQDFHPSSPPRADSGRHRGAPKCKGAHAGGVSLCPSSRTWCRVCGCLGCSCGEGDGGGSGFVEGAVAEHREQDADALAGEAEEGLGVGFAAGPLPVVVGA